MRYKEYEKLIREIEFSKTSEELEDILSKIESLDFKLLISIKEPDGWKTDSDKMKRYKELLKYHLNCRLESHPNYRRIEIVSELIEEGEYLSRLNMPKISKFLQKVEKALGKEIDFPNSIINSFKLDEANRLHGIDSCSITKEDLEAVLIKLEAFRESLYNIKTEKKQEEKQTQPITIVASAQASNSLNINIDIQIAETFKKIEDDDDLSEEEICECKSKLDELKQLKDKKTKQKWSKCQEILLWLGEKNCQIC